MEPRLVLAAKFSLRMSVNRITSASLTLEGSIDDDCCSPLWRFDFASALENADITMFGKVGLFQCAGNCLMKTDAVR